MSGVLTDEQTAVVEAAINGNNVSVKAGPGAGKTFTLVHVEKALRAQHARVLRLTYSSAAK